MEAESPNIKESVERAFSNVAENYSTSLVHASGPEMLRMVEAAELSGREKILDAGCGAGHTALAFAPAVAEVVAMDLSTAMLAQVGHLAAERGIDNIRLHQGDVEKIPFDDHTFDVVVSRYSAHHWPNPHQALQEIKRVLPRQRGGQFILADIVSSDSHTVDTFIQAIELLRDPSHVRDHTVGQWLTMFTGAGFTAELVCEWSVRLDFDAWVKRMATPAQSVAMLRTLMDGASQEVRQALQIEPDHSFTLRGAVIRGAYR